MPVPDIRRCRIVLVTTAVAALLLTLGSVAEPLRLPAVIGDHMVLQRDKPAPLWGWADAGITVTVEAFGQTHEAVADESGWWSVTFAPLDAGGPHTVAIAVGDETRVLEDVWVGEVWLCSGQSNMDMRLRKVDDAESEVAAAHHDQLRLFRVERAIADTPQDDVDARWVKSNPDDARNFSAVGYFFGRELQQELGVPVGVIHTAYGGTPAEAWTPLGAMQEAEALRPILDRHQRRVEKYEAEKAAYDAALEAVQREARADEQKSGSVAEAVIEPPEAPTPPTARYAPAGLYHAMVCPLRPFALRGFVWYQGESNVWRARQYEPLLRALIASWRKDWGDDALPFAVVQLPGYTSPPRVPPAVSSWPELRDSQRAVAESDPNVGLIVTIDHGDSTDIHPTAKQPVAERVTRWALATAYGRDVLPSGPALRDWRVEGDRMMLTFDHAGSTLTTRDGGSMRGFVIAGPDMKFRWAVAEVVAPDTLAVSEAKVPDPRAVRYAWDDDPAWANLTNAEGLPASPFRTDDWPGVTDDSR